MSAERGANDNQKNAKENTDIISTSVFSDGTSNGNRTHDSALRGQRLEPLDHEAVKRNINFYSSIITQ